MRKVNAFSIFFDLNSKILAINEEVQKTGLTGVPGCIEHVSTIWSAIQTAKKEKTNISVVWLDLTNAFGSVPHHILFKAMEHFHMPECIRSLMKMYLSLIHISEPTRH